MTPSVTSPGPATDERRAVAARFLKEWLLPRRREIVLVTILTALLAAATSGYPLIIKVSFDALLKQTSGVLPIVLAAVIGVTALRSMFLYLHTVATSALILGLTNAIRKRLFSKLVQADLARIGRTSPGELVSRMTNDIVFVQTGTTAVINTALRDVLSTVVLIGTMFYLDWVMSSVVLLVYPLAALPIIRVSERLRKLARQTQVGMGEMTAELSEKLGAMRLIKSFRLESYAERRIHQRFDDVLRLSMKGVRNRARIEPILEALAGVAVAGVIALAYWRISSGHASVGDFMGFVSALLLAAQPIRAVGSLSARVQEGLAAIERIYDVLDEQEEIVERAGAVPLVIARGGITFERVSFAYEGFADDGRAAVRNVTLEVPGGATVALVGRSGSGKTTLVNLVPRLIDATAGAIRIDGTDIRDATLASLRDAIAIVSQDVTLFDDTIRANIELGRLGASAAEVEAAARAAAAHEFILEQPNGYDTVIGDRGARLSGGQRQRLALARAILKDAPILLLDEATSALDTQSERLVQEALERFRQGRTTLVIAHRLSTVQDADLICVMEAGRIVETGRHGALIAAGGLYADLVRAQSLAADDRERTVEGATRVAGSS
ncbi:MAG: ABC transporter ATP-binding protein [Hyphomicrobiaceae bacterium]